MKWDEFEGQLARRRDAGRPAEFWWRDDDADGVSKEVEKLVGLSKTCRIPLSLAVIPAAAEPELFQALHDGVTILQHGTDHRNRAAADEKKTEYPALEPIGTGLARIAAGRARLQELAGEKFLPILAPPWNRIRNDLLKRLPAIGIRGVSAYGARASAAPAPGLRQVNTHVDIVAWRQGKRFVGREAALSGAFRHLSDDEPVGWLTHHAVHDAAAWDFLERLFTIRDIRWVSAQQAFSYTAPAHG